MATTKKVAGRAVAPAAVEPEINFGEGGVEGLRTPKNIHEAIVAVMEQVGYIRKQRGANLNYTYAGEAALIAALRPWLVQYGIYMSVVDTGDISEQEFPRTNGGVTWHVSLTNRIRFTHAPSGTSVDVVSRGEAADVSDKANNKAMTGALKYALRQTFLIETGDDPDDHQPLVARQAAPTTTAPAAPAAAAPPAEPEGADVDESEIDEEGAGEHDATPPAAAAPPADKMPKLANITVSNEKRADYERWWTRLVQKFPEYSIQKQGQPTTLLDTAHVRATAASLGYTVISDDNYPKVFEAIAAHANSKKGNGAPPAAPNTTRKAATAKRPSNDDALKKAGF